MEQDIHYTCGFKNLTMYLRKPERKNGSTARLIVDQDYMEDVA